MHLLEVCPDGLQLGLLAILQGIRPLLIVHQRHLPLENLHQLLLLPEGVLQLPDPPVLVVILAVQVVEALAPDTFY